MHVHCSGGVNLFGTYQRCWVHAGHGEVDISKGIYQSCDVFFYTLAARLGIDKIANWAHQVGIGYKTGIDLPDEVSGTMPSPEWKMQLFHQKWYPGEVDLGRHRTGRRYRVPRADGASHRRHRLRRRPEAAARRLSRRDCSPSFHQMILDTYPGSGDKTIPESPAIWETITDAMAHGAHADGHRQQRRIWKASISPARQAARRP